MNLRADTLASCQQQVKECEKINSDADALINQQRDAIAAEKRLNEALEESARFATQRLYDNIPSWYEKPSFVVPATALATLLVYGLVARAQPPR